MELDKVLKERHTVRRFSSKAADWREIVKAIDRARLAPLAGNIPTLKFMLISDKEKIKQLKDASQQDFVGKVSYIVVLCSDVTQLLRSYGKEGEKYITQQAGAAIENFLLKLQDLGLATCWVGAFSEENVRSILQIPEKIHVEALFPIGYEMPPKAKQRIKPDLDTIMYFDVWVNRHMSALKKPEAF